MPSERNDFWRGPGSAGEVMRLALPLIISNSFWTLQITIDRVLLSRYDTAAVGAAMAGVMVFWTLFTLIQNTAAYATTFVAQYVGAGRPGRVGPVLWQSLYFSTVSGLAFMSLALAADPIIGLYGHAPAMQAMEVEYFRCLCYSALPMALMASATSLFLGRGKNWLVMLVNGVGFAVNAVLDYALIYGAWGFPEMGITGAGWATVIGSWASAVVAVGLMLRPVYRQAYDTGNWRFDRPLFGRLMRYGLPSGVQWAMDGLAFTLFSLFVGRLGEAQMSATSIAFTLNLLAFLPTMGIGQAVAVLVGQRLGQDRPDLARRSTLAGFAMAWSIMALIGLTFVLIPGVYLEMFRTQGDSAVWTEVAAIVPVLLRFVTVYCLFDSMNLVFSFALKGAGDTRFVTIATLSLVWPVMVLPTWAAWYYGWGLYWAWAAVSLYVVILAGTFYARFRGGKWQAMRVIEQAPPDAAPETVGDAAELATEPAA